MICDFCGRNNVSPEDMRVFWITCHKEGIDQRGLAACPECIKEGINIRYQRITFQDLNIRRDGLELSSKPVIEHLRK